MEEKRGWTCEEVLSLIEHFQKQPSLWDARCVYYKSKLKKQNAYKEMAAAFRTTTAEIDRKIKNIISQYQRERRNYKKVKSVGVGESFRAKWFGYHAMSFLHDKPRTGGEGRMEHQDSDTDDAASSSGVRSGSRGAGDEVEMPLMLCEVGVDSTAAEENRQTSNAEKPLQDLFKLPREVNSIDENHDSKNLFQILETVGKITQRDESDVFGEMVAQNLKQLKTEYAKITIQNRISNLLYEARLGYFDSPESDAFLGFRTSKGKTEPL